MINIERIKNKSVPAIIGLIILGIIALVLIFQIGCFIVGMVIFAGDIFLSRKHVNTDIQEYTKYVGANAADEYKSKWGMDESIWPDKITDNMDVEDFKMVYYNPWDAQYLGYLVVNYADEDYAKELERLQNYNSTEYVGYYGVTGEEDYELLAVYADSYNGFVYALTDGKEKIIYAEEIFCNYYMDLKYEKYIPKEYLLDGFDASENNPYRKEQMKEMQ